MHDINFVEGIEVSTLYRSSHGATSLHVLGYSKDFNRLLLQQALLQTINGYNDRAKKIVEKLNHKFPTINLDFEKIKNKNREAYVSRNTLARLLIEDVKNLSIKNALGQYIFVEEDNSWMMETENSFRLIEQSGGVPVLAHSGRELRKMGLVAYENMVQRFSQIGLRGLEVYYPKHTPEEVYTIKNIAKKYGLYITGGSDWHGPAYTPNITIGIHDHRADITQFLKEAVCVSL